MKVLVLGIDALDPRLILENIKLFPNMKEMIETGVGGPYAGYAYGYGSYDNWTTLYTGLDPKEHEVINNKFKNIKKPIIDDILDKKPFWEVLNEGGLSVGVFNACVTTPAVSIEGYMASSDRKSRFSDNIEEGEVLTPVFNIKDRHLQKYLKGELKFPERPKSPEDYGYTWEDIKADNDIIKEILSKDNYYESGLYYLEHVLDFLADNMKILEDKSPVDVMWVYTEALDTLQHFQSYAKNKRIIIEAMKKVDEFIGRVREELKPENIIVLSDHGISSIGSMLKHEDMEIQKEAFGWRDKSFWINSETIVSMARNEGIISGMHDYKGTFLVAGEGIRTTSMPEMRSIDFYPTLLELCNVKVPEERKGYILDILDKEEYVNEKLRYQEQCKKKIALIQNLDVNLFNTVINETFLANRFAELVLYCEKKYESIFNENKRIDKVIGVDQIENLMLNDEYDLVVIGYHNIYFNKVLPLTISK